VASVSEQLALSRREGSLLYINVPAEATENCPTVGVYLGGNDLIIAELELIMRDPAALRHSNALFHLP